MSPSMMAVPWQCPRAVRIERGDDVMGIFDALTSAVSGLQAESFSLQNISGNIANSSTVAYKAIGTGFEDLIPDATATNMQAAGGVTAYSQSTISSQGTISSSTVATNMAINGDGFFSVQSSTGTVDGQPVFSGTTDYTRQGDFQVNANGNLVNGAGYYLMGLPVDPKTGNPVGNVAQVLQFQNNFIPAQATTSIQYAANLPTAPATTASSSAAAGSLVAEGGLNPGDFTAGYNPLVTGTPAVPYVSAAVTGAVADNQAATPAPITGATALSGTSPSDSLSSSFAANDTITVNGQTITFVASGATAPNQVNVTDNVQTLLNDITALAPGSSASIAGGAITLNSGTGANLTVSSSNSTAFGALGLTSTGVTATRTGGGTAGAGVVIGNDDTTFQNESISGGAVTAYNSAGSPVNVELRWALTGSSNGVNTWNLFYQTDPNATGTQTAWVNAGTNFTFSSNGTLTSPTGATQTLSNVTVNGVSLGNLSLNIGAGSLTQYASTSGTATINGITQNGYAAGQLQSVAINNNGIVVGTFSNGQNIDLAEVTLSHFNGTNYLQALTGGAYAATEDSGAAIAGASGTIDGSSLEGSNTDIADQFTQLIVAQQAYSADTKVITTANSMIQDLLDVMR
jgi:flagellar hook protein FlgE